MSEPDKPVLSTSVAWAGWLEHLHFGYEVFRELAGSETYTGLLAIAVTGRRLAPDERAVLDDVAGVLTVAEPRIWPNKVARIVASYGRVIPGMLAGTLCFESELIGPWTTGGTAQNLVGLRAEIGDEPSDEELEGAITRLIERQGRLLGFGVPFRPRDERLMALRACIERRGRADLPYWRLSVRLWESLRRTRRLEPNIGSGVAAALLDVGLVPEQIATLTIALNQNIFVANAFEAAVRREPALQRIPDEHVEYVGAPPRVSRRAGSTPAR